MKKKVLSLMMALALGLFGLVQAQVSLPYNEGFEDGMGGWTMVDCHPESGPYSNVHHTGNYCFNFHWTNSTYPNPDYLISPELTGTEDGVHVEFYYRSEGTSFIERFYVGYSTSDNDVNSFTYGGELTCNNNTSWTLFSETFPAGTKYVAVKYDAYDQYRLYLDDFSFTVDGDEPGGDPTGEPTDEPVAQDGFFFNFEDGAVPATWTNDNNYPWTVSRSTTYPGFNGNYYLRCGNSGVHSSTSSISATVNYTEEGTISFLAGIWGEGSDNNDWDKCRFYIDGELMFDYGNHQAWEEISYPVSAGNHTFKWTYKKDGSVSPTGDFFGIDDVAFNIGNLHTLAMGYNNTLVTDMLYIARPNGAWMEPYHFQLYNMGEEDVEVVLIDFLHHNGYFSMVDAETLYPFTVETGGVENAVDLYITTNPAWETTAPFESQLAVNTTERSTHLYDIVAEPYQPYCPDVVEKAYELGNLCALEETWSMTTSEMWNEINPEAEYDLHANYNLPFTGEPYNIPNGYDAVISFTVDHEVLLHAEVIEGENGKVALYTADANGDVHPMADNNYNDGRNFASEEEPVIPTPTPVDPTPVDPTPVDPTPVDPIPVDPTPVDPTPVDPTPVDPTPVDPTPVDPTPVEPVGDIVFEDDFEYESEEDFLDNWMSIDANNDSYTWQWFAYGVNAYFTHGHNSNGWIQSASYVYDGMNEHILTPDNYLVYKTLVPIDGTLTFWACAQDASYPAEHIGVAVSFNGGTQAQNFITVDEWTLTARATGRSTNETRDGGNRAQGVWHQYSVDLSSYAEYETQMGYIAFRHFDCTNQFMVNIDDVVLYSGSADRFVMDETIEEPVIEPVEEPVVEANPHAGPVIDGLLLLPGYTYYLVASSTDQDFQVEIGYEEVPCPIADATIIYPEDDDDDIDPMELTLRWKLDEYATEWRLIFCSTYWPEDGEENMPGDTEHPAYYNSGWQSSLAEAFTITDTIELWNNTNYFWRIDQRTNGGTEYECISRGKLNGFTTHLNVPQNLVANPTQIYEGDGTDVTLTWSAIQDRTYRRYRIYRNGELYAETANNQVVTTYTIPAEDLHYNMGPDAHPDVFTVTAVYDEGETEMSNPVTIEVSGYGTISGTVYEIDGETTIAGVTVTIIGVNEFDETETHVYTTDENGYYEDEIHVAVITSAVATHPEYQDANTTHEVPFMVEFEQETPNVDFIMDEFFFAPIDVCAEKVYVAAEGDTLVKITWRDGLQALQEAGSRSLHEYRIYRTSCYNDGPYNDENTLLLATAWVPDTAYFDVSWPAAPFGVYKFGVSAVYEGIHQQGRVDYPELPRESEIAWSTACSGCIDKDMYLDNVSVNVILNSADSPAGTVVSFTNIVPQEQANHPQEAIILDESGHYDFETFRRGHYIVKVEHEGYYTIEREEDITYGRELRYVMEEILFPVRNLYVSRTGWAMWEPSDTMEPTPEPTPAEPTPVEPTPGEPTPVEPTPVEPTPEPGETTLNLDFEDGNFGNWTTIDADGDGFNWDLGYAPYYDVHSGDYCAISESYSNDWEMALYPDNFLVSPQVTIGNELTLWACGQDESYAAEHFGVAVSTDGENFTMLNEWTIGRSTGAATTGRGNRSTRATAWQQYTVDLSAYEGQTGYVAIRHFDCSDEFILNVDDIEMTSAAERNAGERHLEGYKVMCTSIDGEQIFNHNTIYHEPWCQLDTDELVEGQRYLVKVAAIYSTGQSAWCTPVEWQYEPCEHWGPVDEVTAETTGEGNHIEWVFDHSYNPYSLTLNRANMAGNDDYSQYTNAPVYSQYADNGIMLNFFGIDRVNFRHYLLYVLSNNDNYVLVPDKEYGQFLLTSKDDNAVNFMEEFDLFYKNAVADFELISKDQFAEKLAMWKASVAPTNSLSIVMDRISNATRVENDHCINSMPFCTTELMDFEAPVGAENADENASYCCLSGRPNPAWYHMRIQTAGEFVIHMESYVESNPYADVDIDFAIWGPFDDPYEPCFDQLTADKVVDCSFSTASYEDVYLGYPVSQHDHDGSFLADGCALNPHVPQVGEYYILLITNWDDDPCRISFTKAAGIGETDCNIVAPSDALGFLVTMDGEYLDFVMDPEAREYTHEGEYGEHEYCVRPIYPGLQELPENNHYFSMGCPVCATSAVVEPTCEAGIEIYAEALTATDEVRVYWGEQEPTPTPTPEPGEGDTFTVDFEGGDLPEGWTLIDNDNDGYTWELSHSASEGWEVYEGEFCATSASYINNVGALTPDNWLVSPQVTLGGTFSFYAAGQDASWSAEHFGVFVSTNSNYNIADFASLDEWTATSTYTQYSVDLSAYAGQTGYIAIRHYDVTDMYWLNVDNIELNADRNRDGAIVNYNIYRADDAEGEYALIATVDGDATEYIDAPGVGTFYYQVTAVYEDGCESDPALSGENPEVNYVSASVDAVNELESSIALFPNPTNGKVTIQANGMSHITVVSTLGQVVFDTDVKGDEYIMNMGQYNTGVYMVRIATENGVAVKRVTVLH